MTDVTQEAKFERQWRYIVVKRKHITAEQEIELLRLIRSYNLPDLNCAVVESDWPEYEPVWQMIEARCTGNNRPQPEPVAWMYDGPYGRTVHEERASCAHLLGDSWTETPLYAAPGDTTTTSAVGELVAQIEHLRLGWQLRDKADISAAMEALFEISAKHGAKP